MRRLGVLTVAALATCGDGAVGCAGATQIVVEVYTEVDCAKNAEVAFADGALGELDTVPAASTKGGCETPGAGRQRVGTIVVQPRGAKDATVSFRVVTREDGAPTDRCRADFGPCIVSKRRVPFLPHQTQRVIVDLRLACAGVACSDDQTCVTGRCVDSSVTGPCDGDPCDEKELSGLGADPPLAPAAGRERVLVVYNSAWTQDADADGVHDSEQVARYYANKRGVPAEHVLGLATSLAPSATLDE